jgi:hypothetical protein
MHRTFSKFAIVGAAFAVLIGLSVLTTGEPGSKLRVQPASKHHVGMVDDWSFHHLVFSNPGAYEQVAKDPAAYSRWLNIQYDTRYILQQSKRTATANLTAAMLRLLPKPKPKPKPQPPEVSLKRDWSVPLGGNVAAAMYPAKYTWDVNATPDCTKDVAVYPVNATPSGSLANLVGFNNLYSASTGTNYCPGTLPSFIFAYEVGTGPIKTSPAISLDGTQVAFVESASAAVFHVLTRGTGTECGSPCNATHAVVPQSGASNAVDTKITMNGSVGVTLSSPFIDYNDYIAYVGDDNGKLHKFTGVFNGSPAEVVGGTPSWPIAVAPAGTILTGPIYDGSTNIFVGGSDGNLYAVNASTGAVRMAVINGRNYSGGACSGKILDAPVVDSTLGTVITQTLPSSYGSPTCGNEGVLMQLDSATPATPPQWAGSTSYALGNLITDSNSNIEWCAMAGTSVGTHPTWSTTKGGTTTESGGTGTPVWVNVGTNPLNLRAMVDAGSNPSAQPLYAGTFDQAYFNASGKGGNFYYCALQAPTLKVATFDTSTGNIKAGSGTSAYGQNGSQCGPLTEIYNNTPGYAAQQTGSFSGQPTAGQTATIGGSETLTATGAYASATGTFTGNPTNGTTATIGGSEVLTASYSTAATGSIAVGSTFCFQTNQGVTVNGTAFQTNATQGTGSVTIVATPTNNDTFTIGSGGTVYTFVTSATPGTNQVHISGTTQTAANLQDAINGTCTGTDCGTGTTANTLVNAGTPVSGAITLTALCADNSSVTLTSTSTSRENHSTVTAGSVGSNSANGTPPTFALNSGSTHPASPSVTATNIYNDINGNTTTNAIVTALPPSSGSVTLNANTWGTVGRSITLAQNATSGVTVNSVAGPTTLTGGTDGTNTGTSFAIDNVNADAATNLAAAINRYPGTVVGATPAGAVVTVTATTEGTAGNSISLAKTLTNFTWSPTTALAGGNNPSDSGSNFSIGANTTATATNLASAITREGGTVGVTASSNGAVVTVQATTPGSAGNSITLADTLSNFTWAGGATTLTGGGGGAKDWLFAGVPNTTLSIGTCSNSNGCILSFDISGGTFPSGAAQGVLESGGTSGIIIDNVFSEPLWLANQAYTASATTLITDSNGNVEECTTSGTSGSSAPTWNATVGGTTSDGTGALVWTNEGPNQTSSIYFGALSGTDAVKLTQSGLK